MAQIYTKQDEMSSDPYGAVYGGNFVGGGAAELIPHHWNAWITAMEGLESEKESDKQPSAPLGQNVTTPDLEQQNETLPDSLQSINPSDVEISFGDERTCQLYCIHPLIKFNFKRSIF